jgi:type I restriction enzyme S subunit
VKLPAYPRYKPSGVEWLGDVPEHWSLISLRRTSTRYSGGTPDRSNDSYWDEGTIPWINSGAVNQGLITTPSALITEEAYANSNAKWVPKGALVMALAGQGKTKGMVAQTGIATTCNQSMAAICPDRSTDPRYLYWQLASQYEEIRNMAGGEQRDGLNLEILGSIPCLKVPFTEQRAIAEFLDRETGWMDRLVEKRRELIERLKEKRSALISRTVTRGLPPLAARDAGLPEKPTLKPSGLDWLGDIPAHWEIRKFSREVGIAEGQVDPEVEPYASMLLIGPEHVQSGTGRLIQRATAADQAAESGKYLCRKGDVVYSKIRPALRKLVIAPENCLCSADMYPLRGRLRIENRFIYWFFLSEQFLSWSVLEADRVAMPKINRDTLNELRMPVPARPEQLAIAAYLDAETAKLDALLANVEEAIERLQEYRTSIITAAVTGKIDVRRPSHEQPIPD